MAGKPVVEGVPKEILGKLPRDVAIVGDFHPGLGAEKHAAQAAAPAPAATALTLELWPNYNTIGVRLAYTQDPAYANSTVEGALQVFRDGRWVNAHDFVQDVDQRMLVSKIFGLTEGQTYNVRAIFVRRDQAGTVVEASMAIGTTTTLTTPKSASGAAIWIAPNGDDANPGTYNSPKRTIAAASKILPVGGSLILKDGDYVFNNIAQEHRIHAKTGAPGQYYTIKAEHPGEARILGYQEVNGPWFRYDNNIYWTEAPQLYSTTSLGQFGPNRIIDARSDQVLYAYRSLTADNPNASIYAMTRHPEAGWFYDFATKRLYVKLASAAAPAVGQIRATNKTSGLALANSSHWIVDGIHFEQFGQTFIPPTSTTYWPNVAYGLGIHSSDHIVVRNSTFRHTGLAVHTTTTAPTNILVEGNRFYTNGLWDVFHREPYQSSSWGRIKGNPLENFAIQATALGRGMVIRDNHFDGFATSVNLTSAHTEYVADVDIHGNYSVHHMDDVYEVDSNGPDGGNVNTAIFNNTSSGSLTFVSASAFRRGPLWIIGNHAEDSLGGAVKSGEQRANDPVTNSTGWKLIYDNTFVTDAPTANPTGTAVWGSNLGQGNLVAKNNVFVGGSHFIFNEASEAGAHRAPVVFEANAFHTTYTGELQVRWGWENLSYTTVEAMDAAAPLLRMTNNVHTVNPFPFGFNGPLNDALAGRDVVVKGITGVITNPHKLTCSAADLHGSGRIDRGDLATLARSIGQRGASTALDLDRDGAVGIEDLAALQRVFGSVCSAGGSPAAIAAPSDTTKSAPPPSPTLATTVVRPAISSTAIDVALTGEPPLLESATRLAKIAAVGGKLKSTASHPRFFQPVSESPASAKIDD
jgi:hypothetical protein